MLALSLPAGAQAARIFIHDGTTRQWLVRPTVYHVFRGEGSSVFAERLVWHGWGRRTAVARGRIAVCLAACDGAMHYRRFHASARAFGLASCGKREAYRAIRFTWREAGSLHSTTARLC